MLFEVNPGWTP